MENHEAAISATLPRVPWNKGKLIGPEASTAAQACLVDPHQAPVWPASARLGLVQSRHRQQIRGCDLVALKVVDVAPNGYAVDRATVRQRKTGATSSVRIDGTGPPSN